MCIYQPGPPIITKPHSQIAGSLHYLHRQYIGILLGVIPSFNHEKHHLPLLQNMPFNRSVNQHDRSLVRRPAQTQQVSKPVVVPLLEVAQVSQVEVGMVWIEGSKVRVAVVTETALEYLFLGLVI